MTDKSKTKKMTLKLRSKKSIKGYMKLGEHKVTPIFQDFELTASDLAQLEGAKGNAIISKEEYDKDKADKAKKTKENKK